MLLNVIILHMYDICYGVYKTVYFSIPDINMYSTASYSMV